MRKRTSTNPCPHLGFGWCLSCVGELQQELEEMEATFDLRWKADMRAIKRWRKETGEELVGPDHADLCVWLLEQRKKKS